MISLPSLNDEHLKKKFDRSVSLLCWAYNEEDSIQEYLEKAAQLMDSTVEDYEIILIDDGSTDRTYEIGKTFQEKNPRLKIFQNERNLNVGISSQRAIQKASKEYLFWQYRSPQSIISEIRFLKRNYSINDFFFADEIFEIDKKKALEICEAIKGEEITWLTSCRADRIDDTMLSTMKNAGCCLSVLNRGRRRFLTL